MKKIVCSKLLVAFAINLLAVPFANCGRGSFKHKKGRRGKSFLKGNKLKNKFIKQERKRKNKKNQVEKFYDRGSRGLKIGLPFNTNLWVPFLVVAFCARTAFSVYSCDYNEGDDWYGKWYDVCGQERDGYQLCCMCDGDKSVDDKECYGRPYDCKYVDCLSNNLPWASVSCGTLKELAPVSFGSSEEKTLCVKQNITGKVQATCCNYLPLNNPCTLAEKSSFTSMIVTPVSNILAIFAGFLFYKCLSKMCKKKDNDLNSKKAITYEKEKELSPTKRLELIKGKEGKGCDSGLETKTESETEDETETESCTENETETEIDTETEEIE
ncbi:hypothetical protein ACFLYU_00125 [Candidatus Dependentiae bacterium]